MEGTNIFAYETLFVFFQLQEGDAHVMSIVLQQNAKSQSREVPSLFTIQENSQFARTYINNRHRGREKSGYKIWRQGSAIMRSAFVHCADEISPTNNSFIYPYRFLNVLLSLAIILWLFSSRLEDLILTTALSFLLSL